MGKAGKRIALGTAFAAVVGYAAGVLTAPKSGKQTRAGIKSAANDSISEAERQLKKLHTQLTRLMNEAKAQTEDARGKSKTEIKGVVEKSKLVREKARELLSAVHEGDADGKDLKKTIAETTDAVESLKAYLKKPSA